MPASRRPDQPWYHSINLDLFLRVLKNSIFHPFVASLIPLCLRASEIPYTEPAFKNSVYWAIFVCILAVLAPFNEKIAYGSPRPVDHEEEVIVITGGASGLGRTIAEIYALKGATVAVLDIKSIGTTGRIEGVKYYECDVGNRLETKKVWAKLTKELGLPTVLINCAGIVHGKSLLELSGDDIMRTFGTNTLSQYTLNQLFIEPLKSHANGGTIVTVSSVLGKLGASKLSAYSASKAALIAYHSSLVAELAEYPKIKTILVTPGQLSTDMFGSLEQGPVQRFFGPIVDVTEFAMKMVVMISAGRGGVLAEPAYTRWISLMDILPVGLQKIVRRMTGVDTAMASFRPEADDISESIVLVEKSSE